VYVIHVRALVDNCVGQIKQIAQYTSYFTTVWRCIVTDSLWIKPTDAPNSSFIGITTLHVSGRLSAHHQEFLAVYRLWYIFMQLWWPFATRSRMELQFHPTPVPPYSW